jgi:hypothetical protein
MRRDVRGRGHAVRLDDGKPLAADELRIELTPKDGRWILVTDAWFFAEGEAQRWAAARFGEFRVDARRPRPAGQPARRRSESALKPVSGRRMGQGIRHPGDLQRLPAQAGLRRQQQCAGDGHQVVQPVRPVATTCAGTWPAAAAPSPVPAG